MSDLTHLYGLVLIENNFKSLPKCIAELRGLKYLRLQNNSLTEIPDFIYALPLIEELGVGNASWRSKSKYKNQIKEISPKILQLKNLKKLDLGGNPIETPPPEVVNLDENGNADIGRIKEYFRQLEAAGKDCLYEAKLLIVGEGGAGKTTLAKKIEDAGYQLREDEVSTRGIEVIRWEFPFSPPISPPLTPPFGGRTSASPPVGGTEGGLKPSASTSGTSAGRRSCTPLTSFF
jgi:hypothetical protein